MFYKVLMIGDNDVLTSANPGDNSIEYNRTGIVYAPHRTKLFVFANKDDAIRWADSFAKSKSVFTCEAIDAEKISYIPAPSEADVYWHWKYKYKIVSVNGNFIHFENQRAIHNFMDDEMSSTYLVSALVLGKQIH